MRIIIIGGSGRTGTLVIEEALTRGHTVTALVRNSDSLIARPRLTTVRGTPSQETDIELAFTASDEVPKAVIVTLASTRASGSPWAAVTSPPRFMADAHKNLIKVMQRYGLRKIVTMSSLGTGDSFGNLVFFMKWVVNGSNMGVSYEDHFAVQQELEASGLDFVLPRPTRLVEGGRMPIKVFGDNGNGIGGFAVISRASVAAFLVDAAETEKWNKCTPVIAN